MSKKSKHETRKKNEQSTKNFFRVSFCTTIFCCFWYYIFLHRKNVKISANRWELKIPKDWDISQSLGIYISQRLGIFKITASWTFNFGKYPKNNREKPRPRPA